MSIMKKENISIIFDFATCGLTGWMVFGWFITPLWLMSILGGLMVVCFHIWRSYIFDYYIITYKPKYHKLRR